MFSFLVDFNLKTAIVIEIEDICFNPLKKRCAKKIPDLPAASSAAWMFHAVMAMAMTSMMPKLEDLKLDRRIFTRAKHEKRRQPLMGLHRVFGD